MTYILRWMLAIFATYRLAKLLAEEDGPLFILKRMHEFTDTRRAYEQSRYIDDGPWASLDEGLRCQYCAGVWAAALFAALARHPTHLGDALLGWLGLAGMQSYLFKIGGE